MMQATVPPWVYEEREALIERLRLWEASSERIKKVASTQDIGFTSEYIACTKARLENINFLIARYEKRPPTEGACSTIAPAPLGTSESLG